MEQWDCGLLGWWPTYKLSMASSSDEHGRFAEILRKGKEEKKPFPSRYSGEVPRAEL